MVHVPLPVGREKALPAAAPAQKQDLTNLDFLRAVAVLFVLTDHTFNVLLHGSTGAEDTLSWFGRLGVLFFFVHTSCVLMMSLARHEGPGLFRKFYARRLFRIYPLSIVAVAAVAIFGLDRQLHGTALLSNLLLIQNLTFAPLAFGSLWSLPLEVQMYIFLPFLYLLLKRWNSVGLAFLLAVIAVPLALWQPLYVARANVLAFAPDFLPGVIAFQLFRHGNCKLPSWGFPLALAVLTAGFVVHPGWQWPAWGVCLGLGVSMPFFSQLRWSPLNRLTFLLARYSYGVYLGHSVLLLVLRLTWATLPIYLLLTGVLAVAAYHFVEHPMIRLGYRMTRQNRIQSSVLAS